MGTQRTSQELAAAVLSFSVHVNCGEYIFLYVVDLHKNVILIILSTLNELCYLLLGVVVADRLVTDGTQQLGHLQ